MIATLGKRIVSLLLLGTILAPWPYVLAIPQYAYAQTPQPAGQGGSNINTWGQAAASGAVSLAGCLTAGGLVIGGAAAGGALGLLGGAASKIGDFLSNTFDSIFGGGGGGSTIPGVPAGDVILSGGSGTGAVTGTSGGGAVPGGGLQPVPVLDDKAVSQLKNANTQLAIGNATTAAILKVQLGIATKTDVFDCIAWAIAKMIWRSIAASIIDWINGGFNGQPAFIQNFDRFLTGIADSIAGQIIQGAGLGFLCSPFQLNIRIALAMRYAQQAPSCTLTQVIANIQNFMGNFRDGGWSSWLSFTTSPNNNPYGGYMLGEATISLQTQDAQSQQSQQLSWGGGFMSLTQQTCKTQKVSVNGLPAQDTQQCTSKIQTPGELIAHKLGSTVDAPELSLLMANEMNQIIDALSQQLILKALNGLFSLSQPTSYGDDYYRYSTQTSELSGQDNVQTSYNPNDFTFDFGTSSPTSTPPSNLPGADKLIAQINGSIDNEVQMQSKLQLATSIFDSSIQNAKTIQACWDEKASPSSATTLSADQKSQAATQSQQQKLNLASLGTKRKPFADGYTQSVALQSDLMDQKNKVALAVGTIELAGLAQTYYSNITAGTYATDADLSKMDEVLVKLKTDADITFQSAQIDMNMCRYFPDPPPNQ